MKNTRWNADDFKKKGLIQVDGIFVKASSQVAKGKVDKLPGLDTKINYKLIDEQAYTGDPKNRLLVDEAGMYALKGKAKEIVLPHVAMKQFIKDEFEKIKPTANAKIKNATKTIINGISFDSRLEAYLHGLLTAAGIHFEFQKKFELQAKFRYRYENIRAIAIIFDFYLPERNILIDTKGWQTYDGKMKHKMLKSVLKHLHDIQPEILMPKNKKECDLLLNRLLYGKV